MDAEDGDPRFAAWADHTQVGFSIVDYIVFGSVLLVSLVIGLYHGYFGGQKTNADFLLGGRSFTCAPVAFSLVASVISAILVLGAPAEAYYRGVMWWVQCTGTVAIILVAGIFVPFFYELRLTSLYEYLELRYESRMVRCLTGGMYVIQNLLYQAVVVYAPALAFNSVTGFPMWLSILCVGVVATIYTVIGGIRAVVWTDVLQLFVLLLGLLAVIFIGGAEQGFDNVWESATRNNRAGAQSISWKFDALERHNIPNIVIGSFFGILGMFGPNQTSIQRYSSLQSLTHAVLSSIVIVPIFIALISLTMYAGLVIFSTYEGCDPLTAGLISKPDQILPFYVMENLSYIIGLPGLFIACVFSGAMSTISSGVNCQAAVTWEDVFLPYPRFNKLSNEAQTRCTKAIALFYGGLSVGLSYLAGQLGGVLQAAITVNSAVSSPSLAVFVMAMFMPFTNSKGVATGLIAGVASILGISFGSKTLQLKPETLSLSTELCPLSMNITTAMDATEIYAVEIPYPQRLLSISYQLYGPLGFTITIIIGVLVSLMTGCRGSHRVDPSLVHRWVRCCLPDEDELSMRKEQLSFTNK
ncbi:unnamed protein product, partial [Meganyctiphanes norvegica]